MDEQKALRDHVLELLEGKSAHIDLETAIKNFPLDRINALPANSPHSAWQLLEHIRIAQWDILEFSRNAKHVSPDWPDDYWPKAEGTPESWQKSVHQVLSDLQEMRDLITDENTDLFEKIPHGDGQTVLRERCLLRTITHTISDSWCCWEEYWEQNNATSDTKKYSPRTTGRDRAQTRSANR